MSEAERQDAINEILNAVVGLNEVLIKHMFGPVHSVAVGPDTFRRLKAFGDIGQFVIVNGRPEIIVGNVHIHDEASDDA